MTSKTAEELHFIARDAAEAAERMERVNTDKARELWDEAFEASNELNRRRLNG